MQRAILFLLCAVLILPVAGSAQAQNAVAPGAPAADAPGQAIRVLFIGNSMTHLHDLPGTVARLAASATPPRRVETAEATAGGYTLKRHWESGEALKSIRSGKWDFVVLQEQGGLGGATLNDDGQINDPRMTPEYARRFDTEIRKAGARTVLFLNWAGQGSPQEIALLAKLHGGLAAELHSGVAPIGVAWHAALRENPKLVLHWSDGSHPNAAGSYLAACVLYATFYSRSPEGLSAGNLAAADAAFLQRIAWQVARDPQQAIAAALAEKFAPAANTASVPAATPAAGDSERGLAILAAAQKAMGGLDRLRSVKDFSLVYSAGMKGPEGEIPVNGRDTFAFPGVFRSELRFPTGQLVVFFDGAGGWRSTPQGTVDFNDMMKKVLHGQLARNTFSLLRNEGDVTVQFEKRDKVGESEADVLLLAREGETVRLFIGAGGALLKKSWHGMGPGGMADFEEVYSDYREISGLRVPFRIVTYQNGARFVEVVVSEVKINSGVDPAALAKRPGA